MSTMDLIISDYMADAPLDVMYDLILHLFMRCYGTESSAYPKSVEAYFNSPEFRNNAVGTFTRRNHLDPIQKIPGYILAYLDKFLQRGVISAEDISVLRYFTDRDQPNRGTQSTLMKIIVLPCEAYFIMSEVTFLNHLLRAVAVVNGSENSEEEITQKVQEYIRKYGGKE